MLFLRYFNAYISEREAERNLIFQFFLIYSPQWNRYIGVEIDAIATIDSAKSIRYKL